MKTDEIKPIEQSIVKKFRREIWCKFIKGIKDFNMLEENDVIAVCISGGKDSFLLAKCMQEIERHGKMHITCKYICMNPGYEESHLQLIKDNAKKLNIPLEIFNTDVFKVSNFLNEKHPCYLCARMRRGYLYQKAKELGCNKIALAHHFDDVLETILMSMFYAGEFRTMMPKLKSANFEGMSLIRPLYYVREDDIMKWRDFNHLSFINCACSFVSHKETGAREEMKQLIQELNKKNPFVEKNIYRSTELVNLDTILSYQKDNEIINNYEKK